MPWPARELDPETGRPHVPGVSVRPLREARTDIRQVRPPAQARAAEPVWPVADTTPADPPRPAGNWPELLEDTAISTNEPREERRVARLIAEQEGTPWNA